MEKTSTVTKKFIEENGKLRGILLWITGKPYYKPAPPVEPFKPFELIKSPNLSGYLTFGSYHRKYYWKYSVGDSQFYQCKAPNFFNRFMIRLILGIHITPN